jgi:hypothetical protein
MRVELLEDVAGDLCQALPLGSKHSGVSSVSSTDECASVLARAALRSCRVRHAAAAPMSLTAQEGQ